MKLLFICRNINSRPQTKGKLGHVAQIRVCRLTQTWCLTSLISCTVRYRWNYSPESGFFGITWKLTLKPFNDKVSKEATSQKLWRQRVIVNFDPRIISLRKQPTLRDATSMVSPRNDVWETTAIFGFLNYIQNHFMQGMDHKTIN